MPHSLEVSPLVSDAEWSPMWMCPNLPEIWCPSLQLPGHSSCYLCPTLTQPWFPAHTPHLHLWLRTPALVELNSSVRLPIWIAGPFLGSTHHPLSQHTPTVFPEHTLSGSSNSWNKIEIHFSRGEESHREQRSKTSQTMIVKPREVAGR